MRLLIILVLILNTNQICHGQKYDCTPILFTDYTFWYSLGNQCRLSKSTKPSLLMSQVCLSAGNKQSSIYIGQVVSITMKMTEEQLSRYPDIYEVKYTFDGRMAISDDGMRKNLRLNEKYLDVKITVFLIRSTENKLIVGGVYTIWVSPDQRDARSLSFSISDKLTEHLFEHGKAILKKGGCTF